MQVITEGLSVIFRFFFVNIDDCQHYLDDGHGHGGQDCGTHDGVLNLCHIYPVVGLINQIVVIRLTSHIDFTDYTFFFVLCFLYVVAVVSSGKNIFFISLKKDICFRLTF